MKLRAPDSTTFPVRLEFLATERARRARCPLTLQRYFSAQALESSLVKTRRLEGTQESRKRNPSSPGFLVS